MSNANNYDTSPFGILGDERVSFFIEGANFYAAAKTGNVTVDYRKLLSHFEDNSIFKRAYYYTAVAEDQEYNSIKPLLDFLEYNGYSLVTKPLKEFIDGQGRRKTKGSLDVEMTVDMLNACKFSDHIVLFSGDSDFLPVIQEMKRNGIRVTVVSHMETVADDIRRAADRFVNLMHVAPLIGRPPQEQEAVQMVRPGIVSDNGQRSVVGATSARTLPPRRPI